jgi:hypothetical protein
MKNFRIEAEKRIPGKLAGFTFHVKAETSRQARIIAKNDLIEKYNRADFTITSIRDQANYRPKLF